MSWFIVVSGFLGSQVTKSTEKGSQGCHFVGRSWSWASEAVPIQNGGSRVAQGWQVGHANAALPIYLVWLHVCIFPVFS